MTDWISWLRVQREQLPRQLAIWMPADRRHQMLGGIAMAALGIAWLLTDNLRLQAELRGSRGAEILVARRDLPAGQALGESDFRPTRVEPGLAGQLLARSADARLLDGSTLAFPLRAGEPLPWTHLEAAGISENPLATQLQTDQRALLLPLHAAASDFSWIREGDRIDLLWLEQTAAGRSLTLLASNVRVLSAGRSEHGFDGRLLIAAPATAAAEILLAAQSGRVLALLRAPFRNTDDLEGFRKSEWELAPPPKPARPGRNPAAVPVIRGAG